MEKQNTNAGLELLSLLKQQRYLYHQLKMLTDRHRQAAGTTSPELLLEVIYGRRKLVEKLRQLNHKLRPIRAGWDKLSPQIEPEHKAQASSVATQVKKIVADIVATVPSDLAQNLPLNGDCIFDELLADHQPQQ
ncbi:MAG TPA: hypothetical protein VMW16_05075 [Sedimentisphaerales bacterium]|nr:hypothetical protein [Sedimentisphaerales bacterium]